MWTVNPIEVRIIGRTAGGDRFTEFVDAIIRAHCYKNSLLLSCISTNIRTNIADGGVDSKVDCEILDDSSGWMREKTIWQYKAVDASTITDAMLRKEVSKPYSAECIRQGYAYRLCICDSLPDEAKAQKLGVIDSITHSINPEAPPSFVLSADDIAEWASAYPGIVLKYRDNYRMLGRHFDSWYQSIAIDTRTFIDIDIWAHVKGAIIRHVKWQENPASVLLSITGSPGVGKTRLVSEALKASGGIGLVVYTENEDDAKQIAQYLATLDRSKAILVVDECSQATAERLERILRGFSNRIRVITINNSNETILGYSPDNRLEIPTEDNIKQILEANYSFLSRQNRENYAHICQGYVSFAITLAKFDDETGGGIRDIRSYLQSHFSEEKSILMALSLVTKIGRTGVYSGELDDLCTICAIPSEHFRKIADNLHDRRSFVHRTSNYYYITPEVVAQILYEAAWNQWASESPDEFLRRIPVSLMDSFIRRTASSATPDIREIVASFFLQWANNLTTGELVNLSTVELLNCLIKIHPETYLPILRRLIDQSTFEELQQISGEWTGKSWGARRHIIDLAVQLAAFPEFFKDAENILFILAKSENEPTLGNNSTNMWKQLFRIFLSGTALPIDTRLPILEEHLFYGDEESLTLGIEALDEAISPFASRLATEQSFAGRLLPSEWNPRSVRDVVECEHNIIRLLIKLVNQKSLTDQMRAKAHKIVIGRIMYFLSNRKLQLLQDYFLKVLLTVEERISVVQEINLFLHYSSRQESQPEFNLPINYIEDVIAWRDSIYPTGFHAKVVAAVSLSRWDPVFYENEDKLMNTMHDIADEMLQTPKLLESELNWLLSSKATNAYYLGNEIGKLDKHGKYLHIIIDAGCRADAIELSRGYIKGLLETYPHHSSEVNVIIDRIEADAPHLAYGLSIAVGDMMNLFNRTIELVDKGALSSIYLKNLAFGIGQRNLTIDEIYIITQRLLNCLENQNDLTSIKASLDFVSIIISNNKENHNEIQRHEGIKSFIWKLLTETNGNTAGEAYNWKVILKWMLPIDARRAISLAADGLASKDLMQEEYCKELLIEWAKIYNMDVINAIGECLHNENIRWRFQLGMEKELVKVLSSELLLEWVQCQGIEVIRVLAGSLPSPFDIEDNSFPMLTKTILKEYGDDERVYENFIAATRNFRSYSGRTDEIIEQHNKEAAIARQFINHPLRYIREWAQSEIVIARREIEEYSKWTEERDLP